MCINYLFMETKKERFIKILKRVLIGLSIGLNVFFLIAMIIGGASVKKTNKLNKVDNVSENVNFIKENKRLVSYNDEEYLIYLSENEVNNYTFENFYNLAVADNDSYLISDTILTYNDDNYSFSQNDTNSGCFVWLHSGSGATIALVYDSELFLNSRGANALQYHFNYNDMDDTFDSGIVINLEDNTLNYDIYKQAIELDIQTNSGTMTDGIFETLTDSTVAFIGTIGNGIVAMTSVFYDSANSQLTTIGLLSVIVVAVSLSYFLFRLIIGLIRMRG